MMAGVEWSYTSTDS